MRILASIPVERIDFANGTFTFRSEVMACEVVRVMRRKCGTEARNRYYYSADVLRPACMHPDAVSYGRDGAERVNIVRAANPRWMPPVFPAGQDVVEVSA